jgi:hypothetical protein
MTDMSRTGTWRGLGVKHAPGSAVLFLLVAALAVACGDDDDVSPDSGASSRGNNATDPVDEATTAPPPGLVVEVQDAIQLSDQTGGSFYEVFVVVRNPRADEVALDVSGQVSLKDGDGNLLESLNPVPINILADDQGLIHETVDLSSTPEAVVVESVLEASEFRQGPRASDSPVSVSNVRLEDNGFGGCQIAGTVSNTFSENKDDLQLRVAGFNGDDIVTGGFTYVDHVIAGTDATFEVVMFSPAMCPASVERIDVMPNLGEDKIFNP